jgi:hypothetical protein
LHMRGFIQRDLVIGEKEGCPRCKTIRTNTLGVSDMHDSQLCTCLYQTPSSALRAYVAGLNVNI